MWQHIVIDDFLDKKTFNKLCDGIVGKEPPKQKVYREWFNYDPTPQIADLFKEFEMVREHDEVKKLIHYAVTPKDFLHPIHDEAEFKLMSAIIYLSPEENIGTTLIDRRGEKPEKLTVEWKPNRLMVFCGITDLTWHYYESMDTRYTYNYFLVRPDYIESEAYKTYVID